MPKYEALANLDRRADPFAEILVTYLSSLLRIFISYQLFKIIIRDIFFLPKILKYVLNCDVAVVVRVQIEEGLADACPVVGELSLQPVL